jgi:hypothetical protein
MTDEESLRTLLRTTLPGAAAPRRDLWPEVTRRLDTRPRWSPFDLGLAAFIVGALLLLREQLWLLALHL